MSNMDDEIVREFLVESTENLDRVDRELIALEDDPTNAAIIGSIFRGVHTFKGSAGFFGFNKLQHVAHNGENLLDKIRAGSHKIDQQTTTVLLRMMDAIRQILTTIEKTGGEGDGDYSAIVADITALLEGKPVGAETQAIAEVNADVKTPQAAAKTEFPEANLELLAELMAESTPPTPPAEAKKTEPTASVAPATQPEPVKQAAPEVKAVPAQVEKQPQPVSATAPAPQSDADKKDSLADSSLRIDVALLDHLMNLVSELVLARNQVLQFTKTLTDSAILDASQNLNLITSELQEGVMRARMQPIANVWNKFPRVVRDIARTCGKQVRIEMEGKETELDKTILEAIKDPLTHIVRNSVDHGIEKPELRKERGKNPEGILLLRAFHEGGHVVIEIVDDGGGINTERIKEKAVSRGLMTAEQAARAPQRELQMLIFAAGLSTAEQVTNISGRGVGMDVVRSNIEKIGGSVEVQSDLGKGTTITIKIPLTLAIVPALVVCSAKQRFAIPQVNLVQLVHIESEKIKDNVEEIQGKYFYRLRGNLLPLVFLGYELQLCDKDGPDLSGHLTMVVVRVEDRQFGLVVEVVRDTEEIVVKPLNKILKEIGLFAGATIMGDGSVALIIDIPALARKANLNFGKSADVNTNVQTTRVHKHQVESLLIATIGGHQRVAIPLKLVNRLEKFNANQVEPSASGEVVQYRDELLPIVDVAKFFSLQAHLEQEVRNVVVYRKDGRNVGLLVDEIVDIIEQTLELKRASAQPGLIGSFVVADKVTDLLDVDELLEKDKSWVAGF